jgi:hypothetical protein
MLAKKDIMSRPSIKKIKRKYLNEKLSTGSVKDQKLAGLQILRETDGLRHEAERVSKCTTNLRCNSKYCPTCSNPRASKSFRRVKSSRQRNNSGKGSTARRSGEYRVAAGFRMISPFDGVPRVMMQCVTINLALVPVSGNIRVEISKWRKKLRQLFGTFSYGVIVRGKFDFVLKYADSLNFDLPDSELPDCIGGNPLPHSRYAMLHFHAVVFDPMHSRYDVRKILSEAFPGRSRVCVRRAKNDIIHSNGTITGGPQGYFEYLSMEKIEVGFGDESCDAFIEYATLDQLWNRRNSNFSYGKSTSKSGLVIDQRIVSDMERERRQEDISKNWHNLGAARQFLHVWMMGASEILEAIIGAKSDRNASVNHPHVQDQLIPVLGLYSNWIKGNVQEKVDFTEFFFERASYLSNHLRI